MRSSIETIMGNNPYGDPFLGINSFKNLEKHLTQIKKSTLSIKFYKAADIDLIARELLDLSSNRTLPGKEEITQKFFSLISNEKISPSTRRTLENKTELLRWLYISPDALMATELNDAQRFAVKVSVIDTARSVANFFMGLTPESREVLVEDEESELPKSTTSEHLESLLGLNSQNAVEDLNLEVDEHLDIDKALNDLAEETKKQVERLYSKPMYSQIIGPDFVSPFAQHREQINVFFKNYVAVNKTKTADESGPLENCFVSISLSA